jgi:[protein-PII] uridylyltransferase
MTIGEKLPSAERVSEALRRRTEEVERQVSGLHEAVLAPAFPEGLAVLAVGGFGRRELFPHSDVDLLLLVDRHNAGESRRAAIAAFWQELWDRKLRVGHSTRVPAECSELNEDNVELNISLLDQRFLAGDRALYEYLAEERLPRFVERQREPLSRALCRMARERHSRHGGSIYELEPDVKEGPGGLRDFHLVQWLRHLRTGTGAPAPEPELAGARDFLFAVRAFLHLRSGRDRNRLTFELQDECAGEEEPAEWMRRYFSHARRMHRAALDEMEAAEERSSSLLVQFRDWRSRAASGDFHVSRERVYLRAPHRLEYEPLLAIELFRFAARHGVRPAADTERRLREHLPRLRRYFAEARPLLWPALKSLLAAPHAALALRAMHDTGTLGAVFPEWERIDCLVVRDFYHRYTVDEHTLTAIQAISDLAAGRAGDSRFTDLLGEAGDPALILFALLFHDAGKAAGSGAHVAASAEAAAAALERVRAPGEERQIVRQLIEHHLDLSAAMNSRDLGDPATARWLADRAGTVEILKMLVLVTYGDIAAVHPGAMTPWRREQLWRAYLAAHEELTRELATGRIHDPGAAEFIEGFPVRYLRTHTPEDIAGHIELERRSRERGVAVDIRYEGGYYRLTLVSRDRSAVLASIAGALAGFGMNILKAEGFANTQGAILDTFVFSDPHRTLELNPPEFDRLRSAVERVTLGKLDSKALLKGRPRPALPTRRARIRPAVTFDAGASDCATLIQVIAEDRPGLLYALASALSAAGANIELVLVETQAHKAIDVFYVTSGGRKLAPEEEAPLREALLSACQG